MVGISWIIFIAATVIVANLKNLNVLFFFILSVFLGPLALIAALIVPDQKMIREDQDRSVRVSDGVLSLEEARVQLAQLKRSLEAFQARIKILEERIQGLSGEEGRRAGVLAEKVRNLERGSSSSEAVQSSSTLAQPVKAESRNLESDLGRYWLSKVGIFIFILGIGLLISYVRPFIWQYIGPVGKIVIGYAVSAGLFWLGLSLKKKEKYINFGWVLLGGAWALVYFTTYAMHHFESVRIIQDQTTDLVLLFMVACAMIMHAMKYRSETMIMIALSVAFITTTIGDITMFTVISSLLLGALVLFLVCRFQWVKVLGMSVLTTYILHYFWVRPNMAAPEQMIEFLLLTGYALIFLSGAHSLKADPKSDVDRSAAAVNLVNAAFYGLSVYPLIQSLFFDQRFVIVLSVGIGYFLLALLAKRLGQRNLFISDTVAAVFAVTLSVPLHFSDMAISLIWLMEIPVLLFIGARFQERTYRYMSYALIVFAGFWILFNDMIFHASVPVQLGAVVWMRMQFILFFTGLSMSVCCVIAQMFKKHFSRDAFEDSFDHVFSAAAYGCLMLWILSWPWSLMMTLWLMLCALALLGLGLWSRLARFRAYMYATCVIALSFFAVQDLDASSLLTRWLIIVFDAAVFFVGYYAVKWFLQQKILEAVFEREEWVCFISGLLFIAAAIVKYGASSWMSLSFGCVGGVLVLAGILFRDKLFRWSGFAFFGLTVFRVMFVDLSHRAAIFRIISFIVLGVVFLGISYLYNRYNIGQDKKDEKL